MFKLILRKPSRTTNSLYATLNLKNFIYFAMKMFPLSLRTSRSCEIEPTEASILHVYLITEQFLLLH